MTAVLAAAFLFNVGQGVLRPAMPLYLQQVFGAHYRMVTLIPVVFGAGKWLASLPTGALLDRLGRRRLMVAGLLLVAVSDLASATAATYAVFLGLRALAGVGWAMFGTVATTAMIDVGASRRRGRAVSLLLMSETVGLLLGSTAGGWLYQGVAASPFLVEAGCMVAGAILVGRWTMPQSPEARSSRAPQPWPQLRKILRRPGVITMGATSAVLTTVQTGVLVFLFPLYLLERAGLRPGSVGMMVGLGVLGRLVALWLGGGVSTSDGRMRVLARGLTVYAVLLAGLTFLTHPVALVAASVAIGAGAGLVAPLPTALVGDMVPADHHGLAIGWLRTMTDTGQILGPLVMGALADAMDLSTPFLAGAALVLIVAWRCRRWPGWIAASA
jgi:MFS family permease